MNITAKQPALDKALRILTASDDLSDKDALLKVFLRVWHEGVLGVLGEHRKEHGNLGSEAVIPVRPLYEFPLPGEHKSPVTYLQFVYRIFLHLGTDIPLELNLPLMDKPKFNGETTSGIPRANRAPTVLQLTKFLPWLVPDVLKIAPHLRDQRVLHLVLDQLLTWDESPRPGKRTWPCSKPEFIEAYRDVIRCLLGEPHNILPRSWNSPTAIQWYADTHDGKEPNWEKAPTSGWTMTTTMDEDGVEMVDAVAPDEDWTKDTKKTSSAILLTEDEDQGSGTPLVSEEEKEEVKVKQEPGGSGGGAEARRHWRVLVSAVTLVAFWTKLARWRNQDPTSPLKIRVFLSEPLSVELERLVQFAKELFPDLTEKIEQIAMNKGFLVKTKISRIQRLIDATDDARQRKKRTAPPAPVSVEEEEEEVEFEDESSPLSQRPQRSSGETPKFLCAKTMRQPRPMRCVREAAPCAASLSSRAISSSSAVDVSATASRGGRARTAANASPTTAPRPSLESHSRSTMANSRPAQASVLQRSRSQRMANRKSLVRASVERPTSQ
jgi:hypothetical protein